jgi:hemoglobin-like flavoprotein
MTATEVVIKSWALVTAIENYEEVAGELLFRKIFAIAPQALFLFSFGEEHKDKTQDEINMDKIYASDGFKKHATGVIKTVNAAVGMLASSDMNQLITVLKGLGKRHVAYGVQAEHYPIVGQGLVETLSDALGDAFTDEVKAGWVEIYGVISDTMIAGAGYNLVNDDEKKVSN